MFDPNIPADHADLTGMMFCGQFQGLKALIDAVSGVTSAVVDRVTTGKYYGLLISHLRTGYGMFILPGISPTVSTSPVLAGSVTLN